MAATADMVARLRRLVDEPTDVAPYTDAVLEDYIEAHPTLDALGTDPLETDFTTTPPTMTERDEWIPTYDLHATAADIWEEKAAAVAEGFDFKADGSSFSRGQKYEQYMAKARYHQSRRAIGTITLRVEPRQIATSEE